MPYVVCILMYPAECFWVNFSRLPEFDHLEIFNVALSASLGGSNFKVWSNESSLKIQDFNKNYLGNLEHAGT